MRHQCGSCFREFFDDAPSSSPPERIFCVFCGTALPMLSGERASGVPFSADFPREDAFALGVIGKPSSDFPDTLKQFRAHGSASKQSNDSLMPVHTEPDETNPRLELPPWRLRKFWTSLAVGFAVGGVLAAVLGQRTASHQPVAASAPALVQAPRVAAPASALSGCAVVASAAPAVEPPPAVAPSKPPITPALEKRFWLDRARTAQRQYQLANAERFYQRVLSQAPRDSEALAGLGEIELLRGVPATADARFREALDANADYVPALVALADVHWQAGQIEDARREYRNIVDHYAIDLYPPYVSQRLEADACVPQCRE